MIIQWYCLIAVYCFFGQSVLADVRSEDQRLKRETLTMGDAVALALHHKPDLEALSFLITEQEYKEKEAWGKYLPLINIQANVRGRSHQSGFRDGAILSGTQLIYSGQGPQAESRIAREARRVTKAERDRAAQELRFLVEKTFLLSWQQQQQRASVQALQGASVADVELAKNQRTLQLLDKTDWLKRIESHASAVAAVQSYDDATRSSEKQLEFLLGEAIKLYDQETKLMWRYKSPARIPSQEMCIKYAFAHRPDVQKAIHRIAVESATERFDRGGFWPTISVTAEIGRDGFISVGNVEVDATGPTTKGFNSVGVILNWNMLDQLASHCRAQQAKARKISALLQHEDIMLQVKKEVLVEYHAWTSALAALRAKSYEYRRAKNQFERDQQEFSLGITSATELAKKKEDWLEVHFAWLSQQVTAAIQEQKLLFTCGYPPWQIALSGRPKNPSTL